MVSIMSENFNVINVAKWIEENKKYFLPPVCNKMMHSLGQMKSFFVGGPNQRKDFHIEMGEEFFYMLKGDMCLKVVEQGKVHRDITIKEGEVFLLPGRVAHSPQRFIDTVGLVIERHRLKTDAEAELDGLRYFVETDGKLTLESLYEKWFYCDDLGKQLAPIIKAFFQSEQHKTGKPLPNTIPENPPIILDSKRILDDPFSLKQWINTHHDKLNEKGSLKLFEGNHQCQVYICGKGESEFQCKHSEIWLWQLEGASCICRGDSCFRIKKDDSVLTPVGEKVHYNGEDDALALVVWQDPTLRKTSYADL